MTHTKLPYQANTGIGPYKSQQGGASPFKDDSVVRAGAGREKGREGQGGGL